MQKGIGMNLKKAGNQCGFSLIELCVVLSIAAVMAAFSIPMFTSGMRSMKLASDSKNIATTLTYAKLRAMSQMTNCRLSFNLVSNQWSLEQLVRGTANFSQVDTANTLSMGIVNSGIAFKAASASAPAGFPTASSSAITFSSRGTPAPLEARIVYLSNQTDNYAVSVSISGKVQVWKLTNNQWMTQ